MSEKNSMEEIEKLFAKPKTYTIPKEPKEGQEQVELVIFPLGLDDLSTISMDENAPLSEVAKNVKTLFAKSLSITEEQAGKLSFTFMEDLMGAVMDANNFTDKDMKKTGIKTFLDNKREQVKKEEEKDESAGKTEEQSSQ